MQHVSEVGGWLGGFCALCTLHNIKSLMFSRSKGPTLAHPTWKIKDITQQAGYFGTLSTPEAEENLKQCGGNCYLIRYSKGKQCFMISVIRNDVEHPISAIQHYKLSITRKDSQTAAVYEIEGTEQSFTDISELLRFYQETPLTISSRTIGKVCPKPAN